MERYLLSSRYVTATLSIIIVAALSTLLMRRCGLATGIVLAAFLSFDYAFLSFTSFLRSLYWLPGLSLMPLMIMLALYDPTASTARRRWTLALFGFAVCLRALCGYEYISVPVLTACAAIFFQAPEKKLKVILSDCAAFVVAGGVGTAVAIASHAVSLYCMFGSWEKAFQNTLGNAFRRSYGEHETVREMGSPEAYRRGVFGMLADNKPLTVLVGLWFVAILGYALLNRRKRRPPRPNYDTRLKALAAASLAGFAASCSWLALMRNHTAHHPQYNSLAFYQGFIWFAIPFIVVVAAGTWDEFRSAAAKE